MQQATFDVVTLSGADPYQRGVQYGEQMRRKIRARLDTWFCSGQFEGHQREETLANAGKFWPFIQEYSQDIAQEMRGIAEGSGVLLEEIVTLNASGPLAVCGHSQGAMCTSFAVTGSATRGGVTYIGQNDDLWNSDRAFGTVLRIETGESTSIGFALAGEFPRIGISSHGIALCVNALYDGLSRPGVSDTVIARQILQSETIGEALDAIMVAKRAFAVNLLLGDRNGELYDLETTATSYRAIYGQDSLVHANHFLSEGLMQGEVDKEPRSHSLIRHNRLSKLITRSFGDIDAEKLKGFLADHINYPGGVCRHGFRGMSTIASIVMLPADGVLMIAAGNPCQTEFRTFIIG